MPPTVAHAFPAGGCAGTCAGAGQLPGGYLRGYGGGVVSSPLKVVPGPAPQRRQAPSKAAWHTDHPSVTVHLPAAEHTRLGAEAKAAGVTMGAYLLAGAERARAAQDRLQEVEAAHQAEVAQLRRELAAVSHGAQQQAPAAAASAYQQAQAAMAAAYQHGRAEADPAAAQELAYWRQAAPAISRWRAEIDELADQVLDYLADRETEPWAGHAHRSYVELVRQYRDAVDRRLDLAMEPLRAVWPSTASDRGSHQAPTEPPGSPRDHLR